MNKLNGYVFNLSKEQKDKIYTGGQDALPEQVVYARDAESALSSLQYMHEHNKLNHEEYDAFLLNVHKWICIELEEYFNDQTPF